jgi:hypothetical protein
MQYESNTSTCLNTGQRVLEANGFNLPVYVMILAMFGFIVVLHVVSFLALSNLHR